MATPVRAGPHHAGLADPPGRRGGPGHVRGPLLAWPSSTPGRTAPPAPANTPGPRVRPPEGAPGPARPGPGRWRRHHLPRRVLRMDWAVPVVRPIGELGPLGLILPTAPPGELPGETGGRTRYPTGVADWGATAPASALAGPRAGPRRPAPAPLWAVDHLFWPRPILECLTALAVAAAATERAAIGTCVLQLPSASPRPWPSRPRRLQLLSRRAGSSSVSASAATAASTRRPGSTSPRRGRRLDAGLADAARAWATAGDPSDAVPPDARRPAGPGLDRRVEPGRPAPGRAPRATDGSRCSSPPSAYATDLASCAPRPSRGGRRPRRRDRRGRRRGLGRRPGPDGRPSRGCDWLSDALRPPAEGLRAPPGGRLGPRTAPSSWPRTGRPAPRTWRSWSPTTDPLDQFAALAEAELGPAGPAPPRRRERGPDAAWRCPMTQRPGRRSSGPAMTDMSRRDLTPEADGPPGGPRGAGRRRGRARPSSRLVVVGNALGRPPVRPGLHPGPVLAAQGRASATCRWSTSTTPAPAAPRPCTSGPLAARAADGPVLVVGVEKMWTGDRAATLAGSRTGCRPTTGPTCTPASGPRATRRAASSWASTTAWAEQFMAERGATHRADRRGGRQGPAQRRAATRWPRCQQAVTLDEVLASPQVAGVLTRLMCSSFTDGAAAVVLGRSGGRAPAGGAPYHRLDGPLGQRRVDYHDRLAETARGRLGGVRLRPGGLRHGRAARRHQRRGALRPGVARALRPRRGRARPPSAGAHRHRRDRAHRQPERRPGRPGPPARGHRHRPGGRAGRPSCAAGPAGRQVRGRPAGPGRQHRRGASRATPASSASTPSAAGELTRERRASRSRGCGIAVPDKVVTNDDLSATLDTSDAWITERTGIRERRVGGTTSELATEAGRQALERAGLDPARHRRAACWPPPPPTPWCPAPSATVQDRLGHRRRAPSTSTPPARASSTGWWSAAGLVAAGPGRVLLIGADTLSRITDWDDRTMAVLVGDGAGAVVIEPVDGPGRPAELEPRRRRLAPPPAHVRPRRLPVHGRQGDLPQGRPGRRRVGRAGAGRRRHDRRRRRPARAPPGQPAHHPGGLPAARHPRGADGGGHRPLRQHLVGLDPPRPRRRAGARAGRTPATACCSPASAAG